MARASLATSAVPLVSGILLGSALTLIGKWYIDRRRKRHDGDEDYALTMTSGARSIPLDLRLEQLSRHSLYFGEHGMQDICNARICVVGVGGVGSHTCHMLGRAGIGYLRMIDFDQVTLSSLNRHACATLADVGMPKASCLERFLKQICPDLNYLELDARIQMFTADTADVLLQQPTDKKWDMVIDAIDDVPTKAALIAYCIQIGVPVLSCMGAGGKSDVTRLHISDLRSAAKDALATKLRQSLRKLFKDASEGGDSYLDDMNKLTIVYSSEKSQAKLADMTPDQRAEGIDNFGAVEGMRIRVLPVLGPMPAIMGQAMASYCLSLLGGKPMQPVTGERVGRNVRHKLLQHLKRREDAIAKRVLSEWVPLDTKDIPGRGKIVNGIWIGPLQVDMDDMEYLYELWRNRCAITNERLGVVLELSRWDMSKPSVCSNLVLLCTSALEKLDEKGTDSVPEHVKRHILQRMATCIGVDYRV